MNDLARARRLAWICAGAGFAFCAIALFFARPRVFQAYWMAWLFWSGVSFGSMVLLMIHTLTGGAWGELLRPVVRAAARTLPFAAALFLPAIFALGDIFAWTQPGAFNGHDWPHKRAYLVAPWFAMRGIGYFFVLGIVGALLGLWRQREKPPASVMARSAGGLVVYAGLMLFASTDWVASLELQWSSTMLVVIVGIDHLLSALAFAIVATAWRSGAAAPAVKPWHDSGNLLLALVMFWAYITFSQFLIIWSGNLPREISWYLHRSSGGWPAVAMVLTLVQFALPFTLLLLRVMKRQAKLLGPVAALVLCGNAVHAWWLVTPSFQTDAVRWPFVELAALVGLGGAWVAVFLGQLESEPVATEAELEVEVLRA